MGEDGSKTSTSETLELSLEAIFLDLYSNFGFVVSRRRGFRINFPSILRVKTTGVGGDDGGVVASSAWTDDVGVESAGVLGLEGGDGDLAFALK